MGGRGSGTAGQIDTRITTESNYTKLQREQNKLVKQKLTKEQLKEEYLKADEKISGGTQQHLEFLVNYANKVGYKVKFKDPPVKNATANGMVHYPSKTIYIKPSRTTSQQVKSLAHEIAHSQLHSKQQRMTKLARGRREKLQEIEAESFANMVTNKFGMKNDASKYYREMWRVHNKNHKVSRNYYNVAKSHITKVYKDMFQE
ncbi:MAG: ImmA/IrrE family metallo-endopeptidase [Cyanobacteria bacterium J149]|nr:MAG: ImmA/IrrE family metallo-endopeptidase [Cyanobacteria bacterium J149]